jgi:mannose-6-phosphate isomerase-like protein (cupin superfamily)
MKYKKTFWVLGHRISIAKPSGDYDMVLGESLPGVSGPPPHYHKTLTELFHVLEGTMEFIVDGKKVPVKEGELIDLPPNCLHTFSNAGDEPCRWINIHSPKGFLSFFEEMGIPEEETEARQKSINESIIKRVIEKAADYDMYFTA